MLVPKNLDRFYFSVAQPHMCNSDSQLYVLNPTLGAILQPLKQTDPLLVHDRVVLIYQALVDILMEGAPILPPPSTVGHGGYVPSKPGPENFVNKMDVWWSASPRLTACWLEEAVGLSSLALSFRGGRLPTSWNSKSECFDP